MTGVESLAIGGSRISGRTPVPIVESDSSYRSRKMTAGVDRIPTPPSVRSRNAVTLTERSRAGATSIPASAFVVRENPRVGLSGFWMKVVRTASRSAGSGANQFTFTTS